MIAVDTSTFVEYLAGEMAEDVMMLEKAIIDETLVLPPIVVAELFSAKNLNEHSKNIISAIPQLDFKEGFWQRVGNARATLIGKGRKARLADSMIAVLCLDHNIPLITRDNDFKAYEKYFGLKIFINK